MPLTGGVVVDERGTPAIGARVQIMHPSQRGRSMRMMTWWGETDDQGRFELDLAPGDYDAITSWARDNTPRRHQIETTQMVTAGDTEVRVVLPRGVTITGRVLLDGVAMQHFGVTCSPSTSINLDPMVVRDDDGRFALPHVGPGTWRIAILGSGTRQRIETVVAADRDLDLGDLAMCRGERLTGRVRDAAGGAIHDARVLVGSWSWRMPHRSQVGLWFSGQFETTTDRNGEFAFAAIDGDAALAERTRHLWAQHDVHGASRLVELPPNGSPSNLDLVLLPTGRITGTVGGLRGRRTTIAARHTGEPEREIWTDDEGRFVFERVPIGDYTLSVTNPPSTRVEVTVIENDTTSVVVVAQPTVTLQVRLPSGTSFRTEPAIPSWRSIERMGTEDQCTIKFVPPGEYRFSLDGVAWTTIVVAAEPDTQTIDLRS